MYNDINKDFDVIWDALWAYREDLIPEGDANYDSQWAEICEAMAHLREATGIPDPDMEVDDLRVIGNDKSNI